MAYQNFHLTKKIKYIILLNLFVANPLYVGLLKAQSPDSVLTMENVIEIAKYQSIDALIAKQTFEQSCLEYRNFKAEKLPAINLDVNPVGYSRSSSNWDYNPETKEYQYYSNNINSSNARLSLSQSIPLTGGSVSASTDLLRHDDFNKGSWDYSSNPTVQLNQPLFSYNKYKWINKIEPKKFEIAKARFNQSQEEIIIKAINLFFDLAVAQVSEEVAHQNLLNADTLYEISQGRYQMGKIAQNDLLQMELNLLNSKTSFNEAKIRTYDSRNKLTSFLRVNSNNMRLIIPDTVPGLEIDVSKAVAEAKKNNPEILAQENLLLEARQQVDEKKSEKGINANLNVAWGYSRVDSKFPDIITNKKNLEDYQNVSIGLQIPILDWKVKQGYYRIAKLNEQVVNLQSEQSVIDFEQNVILQVLNFNQQKDQFEIAKKSNIVADNRFEIAKQRFLIGKVDVLDLNVAQNDRDAQKSNYINSIRRYWDAFYSLRELTLFDFINNQKIDYINTDN